jgi:hypothetical protein
VAIAALVLVYPAYLGFQQLLGGPRGPFPGESGEPVAVHSPWLLRGETQRSGGETAVGLDPEGRLTLLVHAPVESSPRLRYDAVLVGPGEARLWQQADLGSVQGAGTFVITVTDPNLSPGRYEVRLREVDRETEALVNEFVYPFRLLDTP